MPDRKIAIVGGGLVGSVLALYLARRGYCVDVYEKRPDLRLREAGGGRSINLAISKRGLFALEEIGLLEQVKKQMIPMPGRMVHDLSGETQFQAYGSDPSQCINSISRNGLNRVLIAGAEATNRVTFYFSSPVEMIDFGTNALVIRNLKTNTVQSHIYDHIFGADGSASVIRDQMKSLLGIECSESVLEHGYKEIVMPPKESGGTALERNALHIWPRRSDMLIALPNEDDSFTCTLFLAMHGNRSFEGLRTPLEVTQFFNEQFRDMVNKTPRLCDEFFSHPMGRMITVKSGPWFIGGKVLLLGDAAHAIVPFFGQGMNCGFEDCTELNRCLDQSDNNWEKAFEIFYSRRKTNADAIADMAVENFIEMRDKVAHPQFQLEKKVERLLQSAFPQRYVPRYTLVSFTRAPYRYAYDLGLIQQSILNELCEGLGTADGVNMAKAKELVLAKLSPIDPEFLI